MKYIFDTSSFISLFYDGRYDKQVFPTLWNKFDALVGIGKIISVREVRREIERVDDELAVWVSANRNLFFSPNAQQTQFVSDLLAVTYWQGLIKHKKIVSGGPVADPFVIALAYDVQGYVVTQEKNKPNAPSIPAACQERSINCVDLTGFMKMEGWQF